MSAGRAHEPSPDWGRFRGSGSLLRSRSRMSRINSSARQNSSRRAEPERATVPITAWLPARRGGDAAAHLVLNDDRTVPGLNAMRLSLGGLLAVDVLAYRIGLDGSQSVQKTLRRIKQQFATHRDEDGRQPLSNSWAGLIWKSRFSVAGAGLVRQSDVIMKELALFPGRVPERDGADAL